jgi:serine protease Do
MRDWIRVGIGIAVAAAATQAGHAEARPQEDVRDRKHVEVFHFSPGARLGVGLEEVGAEEASRARLAEERGALVTSVDKGSAAEKAGLKEGDVILAYQGEKVWSTAQLRRLVRETPPGRHVALEVSRAGAVQRLSATLEESRDARFDFGGDDTFDLHVRPPMPPEPPMPPLDRMFGDGAEGRRFLFRDQLGEGHPGRLGLSFQEVSGQLARYFKVDDGALLVTDVEQDGPAGKAGVRAGDLLVAVDGKKVDDGEVLRRAIGEAEPASEVTLGIQREGRPVELKVTLRGEPRTSHTTRRPRTSS